ncbi:hypothetical protein ARMGADRAFT_1084392 [Armillaria gallica]|uniref:Lon N-terminal domain-containing protein n=1 Tax=Armillaria gallica TaxID=47427 RepID=A0A2H3D0N4_ARMGA|nr:hypothetical protein ARMGADRAFT_1084392 [Armillaria gallica]
MDVPSDEDEKAIEDAEELLDDQVRLRSKDDKNPSKESSSESSPPASSSSDAALMKQSVPAIYPQVLALPIVRRPLFPGFYKAVIVRNPEVVAAIKEMMKRGQPFLDNQRVQIKITSLVKAGGIATVELVGEEDIQIVDLRGPLQTSFLHNHAISIVEVENLVTQPYNKNNQEIAQLNPIFRDQITNFSINQFAFNAVDEPDKLAGFAAAVSTGEVVELQDVLDSLVLQSKLSRDGDNMIAKHQREYYLMEQLKSIKKELGMESDEKDTLIEKSKERAASLKMPRRPE